MAVQVPRPLTVGLVGLAVVAAWLAPRLSALPPGILAMPSGPIAPRTTTYRTPTRPARRTDVGNVPDDGVTAPADASAFYGHRKPPQVVGVTVTQHFGVPQVLSGPVRAAPEVTDAVEQSRGELWGCYDDALHEDAAVEGGMLVAWTVAGGRAVEVRVEEDTTGAPGLAACVASEVARWAFPRDLAGDVRWPFVFHLPGDRASSPDRAMPP